MNTPMTFSEIWWSRPFKKNICEGRRGRVHFRGESFSYKYEGLEMLTFHSYQHLHSGERLGKNLLSREKRKDCLIQEASRPTAWVHRWMGGRGRGEVIHEPPEIVHKIVHFHQILNGVQDSSSFKSQRSSRSLTDTISNSGSFAY